MTSTLIAFQPEYFRQCLYDLSVHDDIILFPISSGNPESVAESLKVAEHKSCSYYIIFRPEWLSNHPVLVSRLKKTGCKLIGISTEPIPTDNQDKSSYHSDQLLRLGNLLLVNQVPFDLIVHYDSSSSEFLTRRLCHKTIFKPLPLSGLLFNTSNSIVDNQKEFDSIFLGRSTSYREGFLVIPKSSHRHLHVAHGLSDEMSASFIKNSRVSINIHNESYLGYELRVMQALMCGSAVVTERLTRDDLHLSSGLYYFANKEQFADLVLNDELSSPVRCEVMALYERLYSVTEWLSAVLEEVPSL